MKKLFAFILGLLLVADILFAQPWIYDFGTEIKSYSTTEHSNFGFFSFIDCLNCPNLLQRRDSSISAKGRKFCLTELVWIGK